LYLLAFRIALHLEIFSTIDELLQIPVRNFQKYFGERSEIPLVAFVYIRSVVLGKTINKERPFKVAKQNDRSVPARLAFVGAGNALLYHATAVIGIDLSLLSVNDGLAELSVGDPLLARKPGKPFAFENPHTKPSSRCARRKNI
jgi:hypothetical protein